MSDKRYYLSNFTKEQLAEMCAAEDARTDGRVHLAYALQAENAKLRELVRAMWGCISHIGEYDVFYYDMAEEGCGMSCTVNGEHCCADKLHDRMCELGVEVSE